MKEKQFSAGESGNAAAKAAKASKAPHAVIHTWYELTLWNWRLMQKKFVVICGVFAAVQLGLLLLAAMDSGNAALPYESIFISSCSWLAFLGAYIAVVIIGVSPLQQKKNRAMYTVTTLPIPRSTIVLSYVSSAALGLLGIIALQIFLTIVCYFPTMAIAQATTGRVFGDFSAPLRYGLSISLANHPLMRFLVPTGFGAACILMFLIAAPSVLLPCAFLQTGKARVAAICIGVVGALCCGALSVLQLTDMPFATIILFGRMDASMLKELLIVGTILTVCMGISFWWAVRSMKRARHL